MGSQGVRPRLGPSWLAPLTGDSFVEGFTTHEPPARRDHWYCMAAKHVQLAPCQKVGKDRGVGFERYDRGFLDSPDRTAACAWDHDFLWNLPLAWVQQDSVTGCWRPAGRTLL